MVDISLLPKETKPEKVKKEKPAEVKTTGIFPTKFLGLGILFVLLAGGITLGVFIYNNARASTLKSLDNQISILHDEESKYTGTEAAAKTLQSQLKTLDNLVAKHKYWSNIIEGLANYTPNDVSYKSIVCEETNNKFTITGFADTYEAIARLMVSLKQAGGKDVFFDSVELDSAKLGFDENNKIRVEFSISFNLKKGALISTSSGNQSNQSQPTNNLGQQNQLDTVNIQNYSWNPVELKVKKDTEVTWTNNDQIAHNVTSIDNSFTNSGTIDPGKSYKYTFNKTGTFEYYCSIHSKPDTNAKGKIIVE